MKEKAGYTTKILSIVISSTPYKQVIQSLGNVLSLKPQRRPFFITTPNSEQLVLAYTHDAFRSTLNMSDLSVPDGVGLVLASKILKNKTIKHKKSKFKPTSISQKIGGIDLMQSLCKLAVAKNYKVFLLGGFGNVSELTAQKLLKQHPALKINYFHGAADIKNQTKKQLNITIDKIKKFKPDILFVAYGAPYQELWVKQNLNSLGKIGIKLVMVVGGAFDIISGNIPRAPKPIRSMGFEWLWRLIQEPWRWKRQLNLFKFWILVIRERFTF